MDYYVDIEVQPDPEFPSYQLMNALYAKLHRKLVQINSKQIGVSFPNADFTFPHLGKRLRLHGSLAALSDLVDADWMAGMRDHVTLTLPASVPATARYCAVRRIQAKSSPERLRRRLMRRHNLDASSAQQRIPNEIGQKLKLPFLQLRSVSTGQTFKLFLAHDLSEHNAVHGEFNSYGLSKVATLPWF